MEFYNIILGKKETKDDDNKIKEKHKTKNKKNFKNIIKKRGKKLQILVPQNEKNENKKIEQIHYHHHHQNENYNDNEPINQDNNLNEKEYRDKEIYKQAAYMEKSAIINPIIEKSVKEFEDSIVELDKKIDNVHQEIKSIQDLIQNSLNKQEKIRTTMKELSDNIHNNRLELKGKNKEKKKEINDKIKQLENELSAFNKEYIDETDKIKKNKAKISSIKSTKLKKLDSEKEKEELKIKEAKNLDNDIPHGEKNIKDIIKENLENKVILNSDKKSKKKKN